MQKHLRNYFNTKYIADLKPYFQILIGKGFVGFLNFTSIPIIIKKAGIDCYGEFSIYYSIILLFSSVATSWLGWAFMRYMHNFEKNQLKVSINILLNKTSKLFLVTLAITLIFFKSEITNIIIILVIFLLLAKNSIQTSYLQIDRQITKSTIADLIKVCLFIGLASILLSTKLIDGFSNLNLILISLLIGVGLSNLYLNFINQQNKQSAIELPKITNIIYRGALYYLFWNLAINLMSYIDRYTMHFFLSSEKIGTYSAIYDTLLRFLGFIFLPIHSIFTPLFSKYYNNKQFYEFKKLQFLLILSIIAILISIVGIFEFYKPYFTNMLGNEHHNEISAIFYPLVISIFVFYIAPILQKGIEMNHKINLLVIIAFLCVIINVILNVIFLKQFQIIGAAYINLITSIFYIFCLLLIYIKYNKIIFK